MLYGCLPLLRCDICGRVFENLRGLRAHKGLHSRGNAWSKDEIELLKRKYPTYGANIKELNRSEDSIRSMARLLKLKRNHSGYRPVTWRYKVAVSRRGEASKLPEDPHFWSWLAGFIDGEGSFKVALKKKRTAPPGFEVNPCIDLVQSATKKQEMEELAAELGKPLFIEVINGTHMVPHSHAVCRLTIHRFADVFTITQKILPYLRIKKQEGETFLAILKMIQQGKHLTTEGILEIARLREKLTNRKRPQTFRSFQVIQQQVR